MKPNKRHRDTYKVPYKITVRQRGFWPVRARVYMPDTTHVPCVSEQAGGGLTPFERALRGKAKRKAGFSGMQGRWTRDGYTRIFRCRGAVGELRVEPLQADLFRVN